MRLTVRMEVCVSTRRLLLLCCCFILSTGQKVCDFSAPVGSDYTLHLGYEDFNNGLELKWSHHDEPIFYMRRRRVAIGKEGDIDQHGSLKLKNLQRSSSGFYKAELWDKNGDSVNSAGKTWNLCVTDPVPQPSVTHTCEGNTVILTCNVSSSQGLSFRWSENGQPMDQENMMTLIRHVHTGSSYTCTVSNPGDSKTSLPFTLPSCRKEVSTEYKKPSVTHTCEEKIVTLTCNVPGPQGPSFKWSEDGKEVDNENKQTLTRSEDQLKAGSNYTCTVSPFGSESTSLPYKPPSCTEGLSPSKEPDSTIPDKLFGFDFWTVVGLIACGIALLLALITVTACCCSRAKRRRRRKTEEESGFHLDPTNQHQQHHQRQQQYL